MVASMVLLSCLISYEHTPWKQGTVQSFAAMAKTGVRPMNRNIEDIMINDLKETGIMKS